MEYNKYKYIYPPRPETKVSPDSVSNFESLYFAQPKLNGSCMFLTTNGTEIHVKNRHKEDFKNFKLDIEELKKLHRGNGWMVLCGEYMNKSQRDEHNQVWNQKFVIFDILVYEGKHLLGTTFEERIKLLDRLYGKIEAKMFMYQVSENVFRVMTGLHSFREIYNEITMYEMYEGLVLKMKNGKLENGVREKNNTKTQIKVRKETKNYTF